MSGSHVVSKSAYPGLALMESDNIVLKTGTPVKVFAETLVSELTAKGYDRASIWRYSKAARSWCVKDSHDWNTWKEAERLTRPSE